MSTIDYTDAQQLEKLEQEELKIRRTRKAIDQTYESEWFSKDGKRLPKHPTKKRHNLSGKRKWKNKKREYNELSGAMTAKQWNINQERQQVLKRIYKKRAKRETLAD